MDTESKRQYELNYILSPELSAEDSLSLAKNIENFVQESPGEIKESRAPKQENLAYRIGKKLRGSRAEILFEASPSSLAALEKKLKFEKNILRYGIFNLPPLSQARIKRKARIRKIEKSLKPEMLFGSQRIKKPLILTKEEKPKEEKIKLEEIDKKLEEILGM